MLLLGACSAPVGPVAPPGTAVVYVIDRGWHTDIGLPADAVLGDLATLERGFPGVRFLVFGFGERQFYMARHETLGAALGALLPSQSALLLTALRASPQAAFGAAHVVTLHVSQAGFVQIEEAVWQQLVKAPDGAPIRLADGPYPGSVFYAARGIYDAFDTCNTWTTAMLHIGGLPVSSSGVLFAAQVRDMARAIAVRQAALSATSTDESPP